MSDETDTLPLSALQHYAFCPRQCALIHLERQWSENQLTAEGRVLHERAHEPGGETRGAVRTVRALPLHSKILGLHGVADVVEYHRRSDHTWQPFPVEYKRGKPKLEPTDAVQLCAQAVCLEEMHQCAVPAGAIFYGQTQHRIEVEFDRALRSETERVAMALRDLIASQRTPAPIYGPKCRSCSMLELCRPRAMVQSASAYLTRMMNTR